MRKKVFGKQLGRTKNQRQALFRGLISSLVKEGEIETTLAKAKAVRSQAEKLVTKARTGTVADRRAIFKLLNRRTLVNRLVEEIAPLFKSRPGGYLRIVRVGRRRGDNAEIVRVMFTENVGKMLPRVRVSEVPKEPKVSEEKPETTKEKKKTAKSTKKTEGKND